MKFLIFVLFLIINFYFALCFISEFSYSGVRAGYCDTYYFCPASGSCEVSLCVYFSSSVNRTAFIINKINYQYYSDFNITYVCNDYDNIDYETLIVKSKTVKQLKKICGFMSIINVVGINKLEKVPITLK